MKRITGPINDLTLIRLAVIFGNMMDVSDVVAVCKRLRVLPPGAPYWINRRGAVFEAPRKKADFSRTVAKAHRTMRAVLSDVVRGEMPIKPPIPSEGIEVPKTTAQDGGWVTELIQTRRLRFGDRLPFSYWFRIEQPYPEKRRLSGEGDYLIVPTLDSLVVASAVELYQYGSYLRLCPYCLAYFIRPGKKQTTCMKVECERERIREKNKKASVKYREGHRQLL